MQYGLEPSIWSQLLLVVWLLHFLSKIGHQSLPLEHCLDCLAPHYLDLSGTGMCIPKRFFFIVSIIHTFLFTHQVFSYDSFAWLQFAALVAFLGILTINLILGWMPYVNNFSNIGGFLSGFLLGFVLLFKPLVGKAAQKAGLFDYDLKHAVRLRHKLDKPVLRSISLIIFSLLWVVQNAINWFSSMVLTRYFISCSFSCTEL